MKLPRNWKRDKESAYNRMMSDKEIGYLDPDIEDLLKLFFEIDYAYTKSSCSGRVTIVDSRLPWQREGSRVIFKSHLNFTADDLISTVRNGFMNRLWLIVQGPIIHVYVNDQDKAWEVLRAARSAGFKHSGLLTVNDHGYLLELRTGVRLVNYIDQGIIHDLERAQRLAEIGMEVLMAGKRRLNALKDTISEIVRRLNVKSERSE